LITRLLIAIPILISIPILVLTLSGEDRTWDFFKKGNGVTAEYWIKYDGHRYHLGEMVSHNAMVVVVSIVFCLIFWIGYEGVLLMIKK